MIPKFTLSGQFKGIEVWSTEKATARAKELLGFSAKEVVLHEFPAQGLYKYRFFYAAKLNGVTRKFEIRLPVDPSNTKRFYVELRAKSFSNDRELLKIQLDCIVTDEDPTAFTAPPPR